MTYQTTVLADSPVALWPLNESSGSALDISGVATEADMTIFGGVTQASSPVVSGGGTSYLLNGTSGYLSTSQSKLALSGSISVECWTNATAGNPYADNFNSGFRVQIAGGFIAIIYSGAVQTSVAAPAGIFYLVCTAGASGAKIYINGTLASSGGSAWPGGLSSTAYIGQSGTSGEYLAGNIGWVGLYNVELTPTQVSNHYIAGLGATNTTTLVAASNPVSVGVPDALTATVSGGSGTATGTVQFFDGTISLGTASLVAGVATISPSFSIGTHALHASYSGDSVYGPSTSSNLSLAVGPGVALTVANNPTPPAVADMLTATVTSDLSQLSVTTSDQSMGASGFWRVSISSGSLVVALDGQSTTSAVTPDGVTWTLYPSSIFAVRGWLTGTYGAGKFIAFPDNSSNQAAVSSDNGVTFNAQAVPNLNYFSSAYGNGLYIGFAQNGTPAIAISSDTVTWSTQNNPLGTGIQCATFGNGTFCIVGQGNTAQSAVSVDGVSWAVGTMPVPSGGSSYLSVAYGNGVFVATTPSGQVAVSADGLTWTQYATGLALSAIYHLGFNGVIFVGVTSSNTHAGYSYDGIVWHNFSLASTQSWDSLTFIGLIGVVTPQLSSVSELITTNIAYPTGTVQFKDGTTTIGTQTLPGGSLSQSVNISPSFTSGTHSLTAVYSGDGNFSGATSPPVSLLVVARATTTVLTVTPSTINAGDASTLSATVTPSSGATTPTGTVTFYLNGTPIGTRTLVSSVATLTTTFDTAGVFSMTAIYNGDATHDTSTSPAQTLTVVGKSVTALNLVLAINPVPAGTLQTLTTNLLGASSPTGTITFYDGTAVLGVVSVSGTSATLSFTPDVVGVHSVQAKYSGDAMNVSSESVVQSMYVLSQGTPLPNTYPDLFTSEFRQ